MPITKVNSININNVVSINTTTITQVSKISKVNFTDPSNALLINDSSFLLINLDGDVLLLGE